MTLDGQIYMVEFEVPQLTEEMLALIPRQRYVIDQLMFQKKIVSYALTLSRSKLWIVFIASSESELVYLIDSLPMTKYLSYDYHELMFHNAAQFLPSMSLN